MDTSVFVVVYLLPEELQQQTAFYANNGKPNFDETFTFQVIRFLITLFKVFEGTAGD